MESTNNILSINKLKNLLANSLLQDDDAFKEISLTAQEMTSSDRASFFMFNSQLNLLETHFAQGVSTKIEVLLGEGIIGTCAQTKQVIMENDVDITKKFNPNIDLGSGYVTTNTLAVPILDANNTLLGVIQVLNKKILPYDEKDEEFLIQIAEIAANYINPLNQSIL